MHALLNVLYPSEVVSRIIAIHILRSSMKDEFYWVGMKNGGFSV